LFFGFWRVEGEKGNKEHLSLFLSLNLKKENNNKFQGFFFFFILFILSFLSFFLLILSSQN